MNLMDLYYKAFRAFRNHTYDDTSSKKLRKVIAHANQQNDLLTSIKYECHIEIDWIKNIEEGLIYVEKAIRENRQFIRTEGEVYPIEKVKSVSKASVEHLSRHSEYITRVPKDNKDNLIPEKLYVVEKLNDYLVYENRFIYLLLCYLKDFIEMRLNTIKDKTTSYQTHLKVRKELDENQRHLKYELDYDDLYKNDPLLMERYKQIPLVDRVENIYALTVALMATPLMKEVSKAPLIKPPVVKTNVLRMNQNFRASLKLYDYVTSYSKNGYDFQEVKKTFTPFPNTMSDEFAETVQLTSTIAYIVGNDISDELEERFETKKNEQIEAEGKKVKEELKRLKKRMTEMNEDSSEYIYRLEKRNASLERSAVELTVEKEKNFDLVNTINTLNDKKKSLVKKLERRQIDLANKTDEINTLNQKYFDDMTSAEEIHQQELQELEQKHTDHIAKLSEKHNASISDLKEKHQEELKILKTTHENQYNELLVLHKTEKEEILNKHREEITSLNTEISDINNRNDSLELDIKEKELSHKKISHDYDMKINTLKKDLKRLNDEKKFANAQYTALKKQQGLLPEKEDFSSKQKFRQLELEMIAYKKLFKEQWKKAKSQIREKVKDETFVSDQED